MNCLVNFLSSMCNRNDISAKYHLLKPGMKNLIIAICLFSASLISCQSRVDLLEIKFGENISRTINSERFRKGLDRNVSTGIWASTTEQPEGFQIGDVNLSAYRFPDGALADYSYADLLIEDETDPGYLGFEYTSVNEKEGQKLLGYLKKSFPKFEYRPGEGQDVYFWDIPKKDAWMFMTQGIRSKRKNGNMMETRLMYVRRGVRQDNTRDPKEFTVWQHFDYVNKKK